MAEPAPLAPTSLVGSLVGRRYRLTRLIGEGGMGAVYEATDIDGKRIAVKVLRPELVGETPEYLARFLHECTATAKLRHPNVVGVLDAGSDLELGVPYLAMELLEGIDVRRLLAQDGALDPWVAVRIALDASSGLAAAHAAGVIHRDVKPDNIFLAHGARGVVTVKVCDFGVAKTAAAHADAFTRTGRTLGSPLYMSPEQARDAKHVDARADVWSLGVTLYEMLSGRTPVDPRESFAKILVAICQTDAPELQGLAPWLDPRLAVAVHGALHRDPAARWPTIAAFAGTLRAVLEDARGGVGAIDVDDLVGISLEVRRSVAPRAVLPVAAPGSSKPPPPGEDPLLGASLGGRYRLEKLLGKGGMGAVYEAVDAAGGRFAAKVILAETANKSVEARRRFLREARAAASITSPNVVKVVEADSDLATGAPFLMLELLHGEDLGAAIARLGALEPACVVRLALQACDGLAAAHKKSIVHRDIKPANVFLHAAGDGEIVVKICDFGIAKHTAGEVLDGSAASLTRTGGVLGSPIYMSPEQAKNAKNVGPQSDVWSLCLTLWEALSGQRPWAEASTIGELILAICTEQLPPLATVAPWVPPDVARVVMRGLARDPAARWADIDELAAALAKIDGGARELRLDAIRAVSDTSRASRRQFDAFGATEEGKALSESQVGTTLAADSLVRSPPLESRGRFAVVAVAVAVLGAGALFFWSRRDVGPIDAAPASTPARIASPPAAASTPAPREPASAPVPEVSVGVGAEAAPAGSASAPLPVDSASAASSSAAEKAARPTGVASARARPAVTKTAAPAASAVPAPPAPRASEEVPSAPRFKNAW